MSAGLPSKERHDLYARQLKLFDAERAQVHSKSNSMEDSSCMERLGFSDRRLSKNILIDNYACIRNRVFSADLEDAVKNSQSPQEA
jgi:hypothetical protein